VFFLRNTSIKHYIIIMSGLIFIPQAQADDVLTLQASLKQMLQHNRALLASTASAEAVQTSVQAAHARYFPNIDVSVGWRDSNDPLQVFGTKLEQKSVTAADFAPNSLNSPSFRQNYQTRLGLKLPIFTGGALQAMEEQAQAHAQASSLSLDFQKQQSMYQTIALYVQARRAWEQWQVSKTSVQAAKKRWQDSKAMNDKGIALISDVMHAHVYLLQRQLSSDQAAAAYQDAREQLAMMMGSKQDTWQSTLQVPHLHLPSLSVQHLTQHAEQRRADYLALKQQLQAASALKKQQDAHDMPQVSLMAAQTWNSNTPNLKNGNSMIGVQVQFNVFDGGQTHAAQRQAAWQHSALEWKLQDKAQHIQHEIKQAYRALKLAQSSRTRQQESRKQTGEALRIQSLRYQQGLETTSNLLDAQLAWDEAQMAVIQANYDVLLAKTALLLAAGLLNQGAIE